DARRGGHPPACPRGGPLPEPGDPLPAGRPASRAPGRGGRDMNKKLLLPLIGQPDPNAVKDVHLVGRYAVGVTWGDEHGSIFPFERLRRLCPCGACADATTLPATAAWPRDIKRGGDG